jgi:WD40 repeat protein
VSSPCEPVFAYSDSDGFNKTNTHRIRLWNFQSQTEVLNLRLTNLCVGLAFSPDGQRLVTLSVDLAKSTGELAIWRRSDGAELASFPAFVLASTLIDNILAVAPDFGVAAYCGPSNSLYVVDLAKGTNRWMAKTRSKDSNFETLAISPDGKLLVSAEGFGDPLMRFWDLATGVELGAPLAAQEDWIGALQFLPDGRTLVSAGGDHTIRLWDVSQPRNVRAKGHPLLGQESGIGSVAALPDGKTLISGAQDGSVCVWDVTGERRDEWQATFPKTGTRWEFAPDGQSIFAIETNRVVQWHGPRYEARTHLFDQPPDAGDQYGFSTDGRLLVTVSSNGVLQLCDMQQGRLVRQFGTYPAGVNLAPFRFGRKTLLAGRGDHVDLWDLETFQIVRSWPGPVAGEYFDVADDGKWVLKSEYTGTFTRTDVATGQDISRQLDINQVIDLKFTRDGRHFAASSWLGYAGVWATESLRREATVGNHRMPMEVAWLSPDGSRLLTSDFGTQTLRLWDVETERELIDFPGSKGSGFSPDGNVLRCMESNSMHIYRAPTLAEIDAAEKAEAGQTLLESPPAAAK